MLLSPKKTGEINISPVFFSISDKLDALSLLETGAGEGNRHLIKALVDKSSFIQYLSAN